MKKKITSACLDGSCFRVEVVDNWFLQMRGLMFRKELASDAGMLFVFNREARHSFWMLFTYIPLDIIWLNKSCVVVHIEKSVKSFWGMPRSALRPSLPATFVLEINAGLADELGISLGDKCQFS